MCPLGGSAIRVPFSSTSSSRRDYQNLSMRFEYFREALYEYPILLRHRLMSPPSLIKGWRIPEDAVELLKGISGRASERKLRLFAVACCRMISTGLESTSGARAVQTAERFADGQTTEAEMLQAEQNAWNEWRKKPTSSPTVEICRATRLTAVASAREAAISTCRTARDVLFEQNVQSWRANWIEQRDEWLERGRSAPPHVQMEMLEKQHQEEIGALEQAEQATQKQLVLVVREVFGDPRHPLIIPTDVRERNDGSLKKLAQVIYDKAAFDEMPILGDALEDAGCESENALIHCRESLHHVRGCHVLDAILRPDECSSTGASRR